MESPTPPPFHIFESIVDGLMASDYAVVDDFLDATACRQLLQALIDNRNQGKFKKAGIGRANEFQLDSSIRADEILWLEKNNSTTEIGLFIDQLESLIDYCNRNCYTGIKDYEIHFAAYPPGAYYHRHIDQFKRNDHRRFTFILYLNFGWEPSHGGMLRMYLQDGDDNFVDVAPIAGRIVCFRSANIPHEVLLTHHIRYSITGWWLDQEKSLSFL